MQEVNTLCADCSANIQILNVQNSIEFCKLPMGIQKAIVLYFKESVCCRSSLEATSQNLKS